MQILNTNAKINKTEGWKTCSKNFISKKNFTPVKFSKHKNTASDPPLVKCKT